MTALYIVLGLLIGAVLIAWEIGSDTAKRAKAAHKQGRVTPAEARA
jgi:hypothetical protein